MSGTLPVSQAKSAKNCNRQSRVQRARQGHISAHPSATIPSAVKEPMVQDPPPPPFEALLIAKILDGERYGEHIAYENRPIAAVSRRFRAQSSRRSTNSRHKLAIAVRTGPKSLAREQTAIASTVTA